MKRVIMSDIPFSSEHNESLEENCAYGIPFVTYLTVNYVLTRYIYMNIYMLMHDIYAYTKVAPNLRLKDYFTSSDRYD